MAIATHIVIGIRKTFAQKMQNDKRLAELAEMIAAGGGTYVHAQEYAELAAAALSQTILEYVTVETVPEITMELAEAILKPTLKTGFESIEAISRAVQQNLNAAAGIGLKAVGARQNMDRVQGLCTAVSGYDNTAAALWIFGEPVTTYMRTIPADVLKANVEFQGRAGLEPMIARRSVGKCCDYCDRLAGMYYYPVIDTDVYRRHDRCRCTVDYIPGDGRVQNVHSKRWIDMR